MTCPTPTPGGGGGGGSTPDPSCLVTLLCPTPTPGSGTGGPGGTGDPGGGSSGSGSTGYAALAGLSSPYNPASDPASASQDAAALLGTAPPDVLSLLPIAGLNFGNAPFLWPAFAALDALTAAGLVWMVRRNRRNAAGRDASDS
ncbi:MAG: hypothetical protein JOY68_09640 [Candidatus Dormibacteraeota bacterium]|nr:hypothetical protein [Candidatus Dormibacteraeota bacterium]